MYVKYLNEVALRCYYAMGLKYTLAMCFAC